MTKAGEKFIRDLPDDKEIRGEYSNVVGLPVARLYQELSRMESNEQSADSE